MLHGNSGVEESGWNRGEAYEVGGELLQKQSVLVGLCREVVARWTECAIFWDGKQTALACRVPVCLVQVLDHAAGAWL